MEAARCSSIAAACSHIEGSGPHYTLARCRGAQLLGLAGAACTGCTKPAVQTNTHRNRNGGKRNGVSGRLESKHAHVDKHTLDMHPREMGAWWHEEVACWDHASGMSGGGGRS